MININPWKRNAVEGSWRRSANCYSDNRGHFIVSFEEEDFIPGGIRFIQDNLSYSKKNVLRGLHTQHKQWQLVTVAVGEILYFSLDVNMHSTSFKQISLNILNSKKENQILGSPGIAHGFLVLSEFAVLNYKSSISYGVTPEYVIDINPYVPISTSSGYIQSVRDKNAYNIEKFSEVAGFIDFQEYLKGIR